MPPNYVTKPIKHTEPVEHGGKKEKKRRAKKTRSATPKLVKTKDKKKDKENTATAWEKNNLNKKNLNRFISHGVVGTNYLSALARRYGVEFTPYLLQIEVKLYFGSTLLKCNTFGSSNTKECLVRSRMIPFSFAPKWYEWLEFDGKFRI